MQHLWLPLAESTASAIRIDPIDATVIVAYLVGIIAIGLVFSKIRDASSQDYFLAGRSLRWPMIGLALFATNISTVHLVGLAADGYREGLVVGNFEWMATFHLALLGLVFAPFYFRNKISTLPEYLERRYSRASRMLFAVMGVVGALMIHIGLSLYAGSTILHHFFGISVFSSILLISAATALYTVLGGLRAVVVTEAIQTVLLLFGAICVTWFCFQALGERGIHSLEDLRAVARPNQLNVVRSEGDFPWYAMLLGYPVLAIWYWCADQTIVQRVLAAETEQDAQLGPLFAGFIKILPMFVMCLPGVMAYVLFADRIGDDPNRALSVLIEELVPVGLRGLIAAALLAALMSTIAGALNSTATLVSIDLVKNLRPQTTDRELVTAGRVTACVVMVLAMAWSTYGDQFESVFEGGNKMIACLAPPISTVFIWGVFWRRGTQQAALATLVVGSLLGATVFVLDFPVFGETHWISDWLGIPFMLQAWWMFVICGCVYVTVSWLTPRPARVQIEGLCWENPLRALFGQPWAGLADPRGIAGVLVGAMVCLYLTFA